MQKKKNCKLKNKCLIIVLAIITFCFSCLNLTASIFTNAINITGYSKVLDDLKIDDNFNVDDYESNANDMSIKLIQVAETTGGELMLYFYQPAGKTKQFELTTVSLSQAIGDNAKFDLYNLKLISSDSVFTKYKVNNLKLKQDVVRYYQISEIHRKFNADFGDTQPSNGNTTSEVAHNISQLWTACTLNGETYYNCTETETILITDKYVGFVEYEDGFSLSSVFGRDTSCHSHFVAFSTDHDIDRLLEADVSYVSQLRSYYKETSIIDEITYGSVETKTITLSYDDEVTYTDDALFTKQVYTWHRIQTIDDFLDSTANVNVYEKTILNVTSKTLLKESSKNKIKDMQFVLRFAETDYSNTEVKLSLSPLVSAVPVTAHKIVETAISDVTILRLKFEYDGQIYNLGVVDNKTNGSGISDSYTEWTVELSETFKSVLKVLGYIILVLIVAVGITLLSMFTPVFKICGKVIVKIGKVIWWIISAPFVFLLSLIKKE